jgi:hypothetical protein
MRDIRGAAKVERQRHHNGAKIGVKQPGYFKVVCPRIQLVDLIAPGIAIFSAFASNAASTMYFSHLFNDLRFGSGRYPGRRSKHHRRLH